ncbi:MAG: hypothetical protein QNJ81_07275 [Acidimicrobiia bacterium]|nr:hypothetical protein [Acidimicrobiia bacterium]
MAESDAIEERAKALVSSQVNANPGAIVASLVPTLAFLAADRWFGLVPAMLIATAASVVLIVGRRSQGRSVGLLLPLSLAYVLVRGIAAVLTESENVFFGFGIALGALAAIVVGASAFTRRPFALLVLPLFVRFRHVTQDHPVYRRVAAQITFLWAVAELAITGWEAWHLSQSTGSEFVVGRAVVAWPIMAGVIFFLLFYVRFRLEPYERQLAWQGRSA